MSVRIPSTMKLPDQPEPLRERLLFSTWYSCVFRAITQALPVHFLDAVLHRIEYEPAAFPKQDALKSIQFLRKPEAKEIVPFTSFVFLVFFVLVLRLSRYSYSYSHGRCTRSSTILSWRLCGQTLAFVFVWFPLSNTVLYCQEDLVVEEGPLIDQQPFDLLHLTKEAGGETFKVFPIPFPDRQIPQNPSANAKIEVVFTKFPDRRYAISWKSIDRIELYEDMVLAAAKESLARKDFIGAFQNLSYLMRNYPDTPRIESIRHEFVFNSLVASYRNGQLEQTLSALEELKQSDPEYRKEDVNRGLNNVARAILEKFEQRGDYRSAILLIDRLKKNHGPIEVVEQAESRMAQLQQSMMEDAQGLFREKRYREAYKAAYACLSLAPESQQARDLIKQLSSAHSMVRVGVMQLSSNLEPNSLISWASRRSGLLVYQPFFQFLQTGNEGGNYAFAFGKYRLSDDRQSLQLNLNSPLESNWDCLGISQLILERASPESTVYDPVWASVFDSVQAKSATQVDVNLQRPNVLPHALMQWSLQDETSDAGWLPGSYERTHYDGKEAVYTLRPSLRNSGLPAEVIEVRYDTAQQAITDLARGYIDVIDQIFPADARSLNSDARYQNRAFALPSTHLLIPVSDHAYLSQEKFRRALLYATDRENILKNELLGSPDQREGRVVSGPFPLGNSDTDPLAYAYNRDIQPVAYNAQLGRLLVSIVQQELSREANKAGTSPPPLEKLVIGCQDFEFAKVATQALIQQWAVIGLEAEMRVLSFEEDPRSAKDCDLLYVTTTLWEPAADIQRLLGGQGLTSSDNSYVVQALNRVHEARNWRDVRTALQDLHRVVAYHLPILPLWQVTDRFATRRGIQGIQDRPVSLYQDISKWRLASPSPSNN